MKQDLRPQMALRPTGAQSVLLAHGEASLNDEYRGLLPGGGPTSIAIDFDDAPTHPARAVRRLPLAPAIGPGGRWHTGNR